SKIEYLECKFSAESSKEEVGRVVKLGSQAIAKRDIFKYLGLGQGGRNGGLHQESCVTRKCQKLKGEYYRAVVRPFMLYGAECWPVKKSHVQRMKVAEMRMLRWMCELTRLDKIRNEVIREKVGVASTDEKLREARLR
uniref:Uncharacterized protein n=1 Tax=Nicotiana tabacum TaxID=4097 RepID=A0A1S3X9T0_TOBAC